MRYLFEELEQTEAVDVYPFIKWVGGKRQLLPIFDKIFPKELKTGKIDTYVEPFVGGGAVLFHVLSKYRVKKAYIMDINCNLINVYRRVRDNLNELLEILFALEKEYNKCTDEECRRKLYYHVRNEYNTGKDLDVKRAAYFIFLNKTCYNGLYRVNKKGHFNVPFGRYSNVKICDEENLSAASKLLQKVEIICADYKESFAYISEDSFVYFDPPYRPLSKTSNFTSYTEEGFDDNKQIELSLFYRKCNEKGAYLMLSNSDPTQYNENDTFFEGLYKGFTILHVTAYRFVNSKGEGRGKIREIVILNYPLSEPDIGALFRANGGKVV